MPRSTKNIKEKNSTFTAGSGITITDNVVKVDTAVIATDSELVTETANFVNKETDNTFEKATTFNGTSSFNSTSTFNQHLSLHGSYDMTRPMNVTGVNLNLFGAIEKLLTAYESRTFIQTNSNVFKDLILPSQGWTKKINGEQVSGKRSETLPDGCYHCLIHFGEPLDEYPGTGIAWFPDTTEYGKWHSLRGHFIYNQGLKYDTNDPDGPDIEIPVSWFCHNTYHTLYPQIFFRHGVNSDIDKTANDGKYVLYLPPGTAYSLYNQAIFRLYPIGTYRGLNKAPS